MANNVVERNEELLARARRVREEHGRLTVRLLRADGATGDTARLSAAVTQVNAEYDALARNLSQAIAAAGEDPAAVGAGLKLLPGPLREVLLRTSDLIAGALTQARSESARDVQHLRDADRATHTQELASARLKHEELIESHQQLGSRAAVLEQRLQGALGEIDELQTVRRDQDAHLAKLLQEHYQERTGLQSQLQAEREALDTARDHQQVLEGEVHDFRAALDHAEERLDAAHRRADDLQGEMARADIERDSALECLDDARRDFEGVRGELAAAHAALAAANSERSVLRDHLDAARAEIERLTVQLAAGAAWTEQIRRVEALCTDVQDLMARAEPAAEEVIR